MNNGEIDTLIKKYKKAEKFFRAKRMVYKDEVIPIFDQKGKQFIYQNILRNNFKEFWLVDINNKSKSPLFNYNKLAMSLEKFFGEQFNPKKLPINITGLNITNIHFKYEDIGYELNKNNYEIQKSVINEKPLNGLSPDNNFQVFTQNYNIFLKELNTGGITQLTFDGEKNYDYATYLPSASEMIESGDNNFLPEAEIIWDNNSRKFITFRIDSRNCIKNKRHMIQSCPKNGGKPKAYSYFYPVTGDKEIPMADQYIVDIKRKTVTKVNTSKILLTSGWWPYHYICNDKAGYFYYQDYKRGWQNVSLKEINLNTGNCRTVIEESSEINIDPNISIIHVLQNSDEAIWSSLRDGFHNLYLFDTKQTKLKNKITSENFHVKKLVHCDEENRIIYFIACGKENDRNPYLDCLYKVKFDGTDLKLLTPEIGYHKIKFSSDNSYFLDNYSLPNLPPVTKVKNLEGKDILLLEEADIDDLRETGWNPPMNFKVKARDNKTQLYGVMYRPTDFDSLKKYPIIQNVYSAPHIGLDLSFNVVYSFEAQSLAELGFIVIRMAALGTNYRGKEFLKHSYKNLKDGGFEDYKCAFKQLKIKHPYLDLDRVGVFGGSSGSYDTANAMLNHGDLYKVGVASAGSYCPTTAGAWGQEIYLGYGDPDVYRRNSLFPDCTKLKGKLLLMQGELDETCNKESLMIFINELVKNNKDFDMLINPNETHNFISPFIIRKRWDYFVSNLLNRTPPKEYEFGVY